MSTHCLRPALILFVLATVGCATTGDWNEDSIFFSPNKAQARLDEQQRELERVQTELTDVQRRTQELEVAVRQAKEAKVASADLLQKLRNQIDSLAHELEAKKAAVDAIRSSNVAQRTALQEEIGQLEEVVSRLRRDLLVLLENC